MVLCYLLVSRLRARRLGRYKCMWYKLFSGCGRLTHFMAHQRYAFLSYLSTHKRALAQCITLRREHRESLLPGNEGLFRTTGLAEFRVMSLIMLICQLERWGLKA